MDRPIRILCRVPGRQDVVLTLVPRHFERVDFTEAGDSCSHPPNVAIMLLEADGEITHDPRMHIDPQRAPVVEQLGLVPPG